MTEERLQQIAFEADYWQAVLEELGQINTATLEAATHTGQAQLEVTLLPLAPESGRLAAAEKARVSLVSAMAGLTECQASITRMIEVVLGRARALKAEALGGSPADA